MDGVFSNLVSPFSYDVPPRNVIIVCIVWRMRKRAVKCYHLDTTSLIYISPQRISSALTGLSELLILMVIIDIIITI